MMELLPYLHEIDVNIGVPRGSVLDPLLFLVFKHDLKESQNENTIVLSFDDDYTAIWVMMKDEIC